MSYDAYRYLWPPRPEKAAPPALIPFYAQRGWWAQVKKNGTCTVIFAKGDEVIFKTRHDDDHKAWSPLPVHTAFFAGRPKWNVYVAELLHSKVQGIRNHLYLFDVIVDDGTELVGETFEARQALLEHRFPKIGDSIAPLGMVPVGTHVTRALAYPPHSTEPVRAYQRLWDAMGADDEGLVFKDPKGALQPCITQTSNAAWQVKVRRSSNKYSF